MGVILLPRDNFQWLETSLLSLWGGCISWHFMCESMGHSSASCDAQDRQMREGVGRSEMSLVLRLGRYWDCCVAGACVP